MSGPGTVLRAPVTAAPASRNARNLFPVAVAALVVTLVYAALSPGGEFFQAYTWLVFSPETLEPYLGIPWTYNPAWLAALMAPFVALPGRVGLWLFLAATVLMCAAAAIVLRGRAIPMLLSAQLSWILWWGQIDGLVVLGLALGWLAVERKSWPLMFVALALATLKPQMGLVPIAALWWWSGPLRWRALAAYIGLVIASLLVWGPWPRWVLEGLFIVAGGTQYLSWNASFGWAALPLLIPALAIPLDRPQRLTALTAAALLISPYTPYYSTLVLLCLPLPGWAYVFAFIGYLPGVLGTTLAWNSIALLPLTILAWLCWPFVRAKLARWRARATQAST